MKVLVAVASKHGSTREIAAAIAEELRNSSLEVDLMDVSEVGSVRTYDAIVLGSAIYFGKWLPEAAAFAEHHMAKLSKTPVWLFSSGPLGEDDPQPHDDPNKIVAPLGVLHVIDHKVFVGKLDPGALGFGERLAAKVVRAPYGDFRDWADVRDWAKEIAAELRPVEVPGR
jgi:menaquinone-dependent protoporphyrinogen oxidase